MLFPEGPPVVKPSLSRLLLIWKNAFPRSTKELESETERGDIFTWQVSKGSGHCRSSARGVWGSALLWFWGPPDYRVVLKNI